MSKIINLMIVFHCCGQPCKIEKIDEPGGEAPRPPAPEASPRRLMLEQGVNHELAELKEIPNTKRCKELKKLQEHLTKLAEKSSLPEDLRIEELTSGIEQAIAMLDQMKMIVRAKRLQRLRQNLAELLETADREQAS